MSSLAMAIEGSAFKQVMQNTTHTGQTCFSRGMLVEHRQNYHVTVLQIIFQSIRLFVFILQTALGFCSFQYIRTLAGSIPHSEHHVTFTFLSKHFALPVIQFTVAFKFLKCTFKEPSASSGFDLPTMCTMWPQVCGQTCSSDRHKYFLEQFWHARI